MNKKILLFVFVFVLGLMSVNAYQYNFTSNYTNYCYQESTNVSNQTGVDGSSSCKLNYNGSFNYVGTWNYYPTNDFVNDGDFFTDDLSDDGYINVTLKKPLSPNIIIQQLEWNVYTPGIGGNGHDIFINNTDSCMNVSNTSIFLKIESKMDFGIPQTNITVSCWNSTGYKVLGNSTANGLYGVKDDNYMWKLMIENNKSVNYNTFINTNFSRQFSYNTFSLNLSKGSNQSYVVSLIHNGTVYGSPMSTDYGGNIIYSQQVYNNVSGNFSYYWNVTLIDYGNQFNFITSSNNYSISEYSLFNIFSTDYNNSALTNFSATIQANPNYCHQILNNASTCGLNAVSGSDGYAFTANFTNNSAVIDGDSHTCSNSGAFSILLDNRSKPLRGSNPTYYVWHDNGIQMSFGVPSQCLNIFGDKVLFSVQGSSIFNDIRVSCYNGTAYKLFGQVNGTNNYCDSYIAWNLGQGNFSSNGAGILTDIPTNDTLLYNINVYKNGYLINTTNSYNTTNNLSLNRTVTYSLSAPNGIFGETSVISLNVSKVYGQSYTAKLIYNGTIYSLPTQTDYSNYVMFTQTINNNAIGTFNYTWNVSLTDYGNVFNFTTVQGNHTVNGLSLNITIYDINTLKIINTSTSTILFQSPSIDYSYTTLNGTLSISGIKSGVYTLTVTNPNYNPDSSPITISSTTSSTINIYLSNTSNLFQFYLISNLPTDNGNKISQGTCTFYYVNNGSSLQVGSFTTDFSGSGTIYLDTTKTYTYICQASGYLTYQDNVKPIVASSPYSIYMTSTGSTPYTNVLNGVVISTSSSYSYPSTTAYFYYNLNTVNGSTQYFGLSTNYNNTYLFQNNTGSTTGGLLTLTVPNLTLLNRSVTITYWYKLVDYSYESWNQTYYLPVIVGGNMTLTNGIFIGNNSITDTNTNPMNPVALGLIAVLIPIFFMLFMHMFGMPKVIVILSGLAGDGIVIMSDMFSAMPNATKIGTVLAMSMTIIFMFLIADNKDSVGLN